MTIHSVTQKDSGEYRCEVTASKDHVSLGEATVTLNVLGKTENLSVQINALIWHNLLSELRCILLIH